MFSESKKIPLLILALTSLVFSRALFFLFNDPEGPNLLIVGVVAVILYVPSLLFYLRGSSMVHPKRLGTAIAIQMLVAVVLYIFLG